MSFEKYGNKLINLLSKIENKLNPNAQIGGSDGPDTNADKTGHYVKILSYSVNHVSVLVHIGKNGTVEKLENPQISYQIKNQQGMDNTTEEYSIEQQLRLGCDNQGNMYNYSVVLTRHPKNDAQVSDAASDAGDPSTNNTVQALSELAGALDKFATAAASNQT